jgi:hypothetical protein
MLPRIPAEKPDVVAWPASTCPNALVERDQERHEDQEYAYTQARAGQLAEPTDFL